MIKILMAALEATLLALGVGCVVYSVKVDENLQKSMTSLFVAICFLFAFFMLFTK